MYEKYESPLSSRYASEEMLYLFSQKKRIQVWRRLWTALARAEHDLGLPITAEQVAELEAHIDDIDFACAAQREREVRHDVMAHVYAYGKAAPGAAGVIHLGATSCYVTDNGDLILYVCGKYMKEHGQLKDDTIVTTIMSNLGLYKACDKIGMKYEKTQVGDKYVYENMIKNGFMLGGEQSGHIIFSKHATTGDGILTSLMLMEVIMETKQSLGQLTEEVKIYPQLLKNVRVADKKTARENPEVVKAVDAVAEALGDDGRILVRESGTEPVIRVMVEAATDELCEKYVTQVIDVIEKEGLIVE